MKKLILFLIIFVILVVGFLPLIDGYLFKHTYFELIEFYQQQLQKTDKRLQLQIDSYDLGWKQSTANLKITMNNGNPIIFPIQSIIHHGPFVYVNGKLHFAFAYINSTVFLPDLLNALLPQYKQGFIQMNSRVALSGNKWKSHYAIPPTHSKFINWEGLSGDAVIKLSDDHPVYIENKMTFGRIFIPSEFAKGLEVNIEPFKTNDTARQVSKKIWNSKSDWRWGGINIKWLDGRSFILNNLTYNSLYQAKGNFFNQDAQLTIESLQLPPPSPVFLISKINYTLSIKNLNVNGLPVIKEYLKSRRLINADEMNKLLLQLLTRETTLTTKLDMDTEAGHASADLSLSLLFLPKRENEINDSLNRQFHARIAQPLVKKVLVHYLESLSKETRPKTPGQPEGTLIDSTEHAQLMLDHLIGQGVMFPDKNDYIISYSQKGKEIILNDKPISQEDLDRIWENTKKDLIEVTPPSFTIMPITTPATNPTTPIPPGMSSQPTTTGYHCYWMENYSGNNQWILTQTQTKDECFALDSCSGGQGKSGGGCYKWASSPEAKPEPWR